MKGELLMKMKKILVCILSITLLVVGMLSVHAKENDVDVDKIVNDLISQGTIVEGEILYQGITEERNEVKGYSLEENESTEAAIQVAVKTEEGIEEYIILPYVEEGEELINIASTRSSVQNEGFSYDSNSALNIVFNATYRYYTSEETGNKGPFYQPIRLSVSWNRKASGSNCAVTQMDAVYASRGLYHDINTGKIVGSSNDFVLKTSSISRSNLSAGTTYYGGTISMPSGVGFPLLFNGIDTYSYVDIEGVYKIGDESKKLTGSYQLFDKFVEWGEW